MCGNPVQALRQRGKYKVKQNIISNHNKAKVEKLFQPERSYLTSAELGTSQEDILEELKRWRENNNR